MPGLPRFLGLGPSPHIFLNASLEIVAKTESRLMCALGETTQVLVFRLGDIPSL